MISRTILEWERLPYGESETTIPEAFASRLAGAARASTFSGRGGGGVLEHGRKDLRARGVVGVIVAQGCQLEILPKIDGFSDATTADKATLRHRLIHMLAVAQDIRIDAGPLARLGWQNDTLLELLIRLFCGKLVEAVKQGMPRKYVGVEADLPTLRGRLDTMQQFGRLAVSPHKLACRYDELSPDHALNQVMKAAVSRLARLARASDNQRVLHELAFAYADIGEVPTKALRWDAIVLDRTNRRWRELVTLAKMLLGDRHQQTSAGVGEGHALLFEMNVLFEQYVARLLKRGLAGSGLRVSLQGGLRSCLFDGEIGRFQTRPDILIRSGSDIVLIVDTKWKRISGRIDDPKMGISQSDVYQVMAYGQLYECDRTMLLYPHHHDLDGSVVERSYSVGSPGHLRRLDVATIDVTLAPVRLVERLARIVEGQVGRPTLVRSPQEAEVL